MIAAQHKMPLVFGDVKTAFLMGKKQHRPEGELYADQPPRGIPGLQRGQLLVLLTPIYGQVDAPLNWFETLALFLVDVCGMSQSLLDECIFWLFGKDGFLGVVAVIVDDLIMAGNELFENTVYPKLRERFVFGKWQRYSAIYAGKRIEQNKETLEVELEQHEEIMGNMAMVHLPRDVRLRGVDALVPPEIRDVARSQSGSLAWYARETRPDCSGDASMIQSMFPDITVQGVISLNKAIKKMTGTKVVLKFVAVDAVRFLLSTDAGWANALDEEGEQVKSQCGWLLGVTDQKVEDGNAQKFSLLSWRSHRADRVCNSTLMAESVSLGEGLAALRYYQVMWGEITEGRSLRELLTAQLPATICIDCKSAYDTLSSYATN